MTASGVVGAVMARIGIENGIKRLLEALLDTLIADQPEDMALLGRTLPRTEIFSRTAVDGSQEYSLLDTMA